jgi:2-polyprenyl-3-methyl-5-hydroxy-6-metoxy-1,4-benzoquinol methylase
MLAADIESLYKNHPLCKATILERVRRLRGSLDAISELDLAFDPAAATTDQNHVGGIDFTVALAQAAGLSSSKHVLDLGCGLGGSMRCLAYLYGCVTTGYDVSANRIEEAQELTQLVRLEKLVDFKHVDLADGEVPAQAFDVIWGQSSWTHIEDKNDFIKKWAGSLKPWGTIAFEDVCLRRNPEGQGERSSLEKFEADSLSKVVEAAEWTRILLDCSFSLTVQEDLTALMIDEERRLINRSQTGKNSNENEKTNLLLDLSEKGILGYFRLVAKLD